MIRLTRARLRLDGLATGPPLWADPGLHVPVRLLAVATEFAAELGPLAICREGRLTWAGAPWPLGRAFGRTIRGVTLADEAAGLAWPGTAVEVAADLHGDGLAVTVGHELMHVRGITDHVEADRLGALLARGAARRR
jgi:hypothetical protein